jgi:hypothetical protein
MRRTAGGNVERLYWPWSLGDTQRQYSERSPLSVVGISCSVWYLELVISGYGLRIYRIDNFIVYC